MTFSAVKDPDAVLDYTIDWSEVLNSTDPVDTIATSSWAVPADTLTIDSDSETTSTSTVWVSAGTLGQLVNLVNSITTAGGRTHIRTIKVSIKDT